MDYKIDATNRIMGRLASEVAQLLRGKDSPSFDPALLEARKVVVYNTDHMRVSGKKMGQKLYRYHSMYHGGLKEESLASLFKRDSRLVLKHAVMGMLPKNKLRAKIIKNLILFRDDLKTTNG